MMVDEEEYIEQEEHWVSVSDLMAGLMMVFLLVAIVFMLDMQAERNKIRNVAVLYDHLRTQLYLDLKKEFREDLPNWGAEINPDLSVRFNREDLMFHRGETELKTEFALILADFFPRYVRIITSDRYREDITEIRIEGHTSSIWMGVRPDRAYIFNMELSQSRTRTTLAYLLALPELDGEIPWIKERLTANGLSSSKPVMTAQGEEDIARSRRVEFRLRTDADARIATILEEAL